MTSGSHIDYTMDMTQPPYEFEDDDAPKPERKRFIPGLEDAAAPAPASTPAPAPASPRPGLAPPPLPAPIAEAEDQDIKPGSRKDLWACPHCGTKNKPDRTQCRGCGKAPSDASDVPFWKKKPFLLGVAGGFAAVLLLWLVTRPDLSLKAPGKASLNIGAATTVERELIGRTFTPHGRIAVCGRIVVSRPTPGTDGAQTVVLLLGKAREDELEAASPTFNNELIGNLPPKSEILHLITSAQLDLTKGAWLSVVGDYGELAEGALLVKSATDGYTVAVDQVRQ